MSTMHPIVVAQVPSRRAVIATLLVVSFSIGMIVGAVAVRALDESLPAAVRPAPAALVPFQGVSYTHERRVPWGAVRSGLVPRRRRLQHVRRCPSGGKRRRLVPGGGPAQHERRRGRGAAPGPVPGRGGEQHERCGEPGRLGGDR